MTSLVSIGDTRRLVSSPVDDIVFDVEIKNPVESLENGWNDTHLMGVACAVVYEFATDRFRVFGPSEDDLDQLRQRLMCADLISGYNIWGFDYPVVFGFPRQAWFANEGDVEDGTTPCGVRALLGPCTNDLLRRIWIGADLDPNGFTRKHSGLGLDTVTKCTLHAPGKIMSGAQAPILFQAGKLAAVINYCLDDVTLTRDLALFIQKYKYVRTPTEIIVPGNDDELWKGKDYYNG